MTADDLEALIRAEVTATAREAARYGATPASLTTRMNKAADRIVKAAREFADTPPATVAERREALFEATAPRGRKPR